MSTPSTRQKRPGFVQIWADLAKYATLVLNVAMFLILALGLEPGQLKYASSGLAAIFALLVASVIFIRSRKGSLGAPFRYFFNELPAAVGRSRDYHKPFCVTVIHDDSVDDASVSELNSKCHELGLGFKDYRFVDSMKMWKEELEGHLLEADGVCGFWTEKTSKNLELYGVELENWAVANADKAIILIKRTKENPRANFQWVDDPVNAIPELLLRGTERAKAWRDQSSALCFLLWAFTTGFTICLVSGLFFWQQARNTNRRDGPEHIALQGYTKALRSIFAQPGATGNQGNTQAASGHLSPPESRKLLSAAADATMISIRDAVERVGSTDMVSFWRTVGEDVKQVAWSGVPNGWTPYSLKLKAPSIVSCAVTHGSFVAWHSVDQKIGLPWLTSSPVLRWSPQGKLVNPEPAVASVRGGTAQQVGPCGFDENIPSYFTGVRTGILCFAEKLDGDKLALNAICLDTTAPDPSFLTEPWIRQRLRQQLPLMEMLPDTSLFP